MDDTWEEKKALINLSDEKLKLEIEQMFSFYSKKDIKKIFYSKLKQLQCSYVKEAKYGYNT